MQNVRTVRLRQFEDIIHFRDTAQQEESIADDIARARELAKAAAAEEALT
jgi:hypothetical protein